MFSRWIRTWDSKILQPPLRRAARLGLTPDALTLSSLIAIAMAGFMLAQSNYPAGAILVLIGGLLDSLDGELARTLHCETPFGAFLDSIADHYGDFALYLGLMWPYLNNPSHLEIVLAFTAMFGSLIGSQVRSRAGMVGIDTKQVGWFTRFERNAIVILGLLLNQVTLALALLAVFNNVSAIQRLIYVVRAARLMKTS